MAIFLNLACLERLFSRGEAFVFCLGTGRSEDYLKADRRFLRVLERAGQLAASIPRSQFADR
jgi:hypothetical protein